MTNVEMRHTNAAPPIPGFGTPQSSGAASLLPPLPTPAPSDPRRSLIALSLVAVALFVAASVLGVLAWIAVRDHDAVSERLAERQQERGRAEDRVASTDREREDAQQKVNGLEVANAREAHCAEAARAVLTSRSAAEMSDSVDQLRIQCG